MRAVPDPGEADESAGGGERGGDREREPEPGEVEAVVRARDRRADDGDPEQPGDAGDGVVHARRDPRLRRARVGEHGRGQRGDGQREPEREQEQGRQQRGPVVEAGRERAQPQERRRADERARAHERPGPQAHRQPADARGEDEHHRGDGNRRETAPKRRVAGEFLQEEDEEERERRERGVHRERLDVRPGEVPQAEEPQRQHRRRRPQLPGDERREQGGAGGERSADELDAGGPAGAVPPRQRDADERQGRGRDRRVDQEDRAPRDGGDEPAAGERADEEGDPGPLRPGADRGPALLAGEHGGDRRERGGRQERARDPLYGARRDQRGPGGGGGARERRHAERGDADREDALAAEEVAERAADEQEGAERKQVRVDRPLLQREPAAEVAPDRRQRDVDDRRVDEHDRRAQDACDEDEALARGPAQWSNTRMGRGYAVKHLSEVPDVLGDYPGEMQFLAHALGTEQVALTYRRMPQHTGGKGAYGHFHHAQEEVYFVLSGKLQLKLGDEVIEAGRGTAVRVAPEVVRSVWNDEPEDAELLIVSTRIDDPRADVEQVPGFWPA